ncbi:MAG TPA: sigma-54 dependent transcriptional regulator [Candidatus Acidoferrales bacterium]|nr:sigma-54 dependent transcriptional regulator [Candidatus Acidoferrales bacterium]
MARILVVDDEEGIRSFLAEALALDGHAVEQAGDGEEAWQRLARESFDLLVTDLKMPRLDGLELVRRVRAQQPETEVIVLTAHGTVSTAVEAMRLGAFDYLQKPLDSPEQISLLAVRALERRQLLSLKERTTRDSDDGASVPLTHGDPAMQPVVDALRKVAPTDSTVLLLGESGTGKEIAARAIHRWSRRAAGPFVAVNCAALPEHLVESELFGHEKGAFTGATERRRGRIELADGGTFFLDEIAELRADLQAKLLRVLQERSFERVGGTQTITSDARWIAATNRNLSTLIDEGRFREDLYHRLAVFPVEMPALRERRGDILPLARVLLGQIAARLGRPDISLDESAAPLLQHHDWRGNVRELNNVLERAAILADAGTIRSEHLLLGGTARPTPARRFTSLDEAERQALEDALSAADGNRKRAAENLGIGLRTLYDKLKRHGID